MSNEKSVNQNDVAGFLLGIGLVVGIIFKPLSDDYSLGVRESAKAGRSASHSAPANSER